jgi:sarcosine oxidase subunit alpha
MTGFRLSKGGLIDRSALLNFTFDGRAFTGFAGDTLASALIANDVHLMGRSFNITVRGIWREVPNLCPGGAARGAQGGGPP